MSNKKITIPYHIAIVINLAKNYTCLLLSVYLPCDTYCNTVSEEYSDALII